MPTTSKTFSVRFGIDCANTIILSNTSGVFNISNITVANISTLNIANPIAQLANNSVFVNGALVANNPNINFISANTSNITVLGVSNTTPGNVTISIDTNLAPGSTPAGGSNTQIQFNNQASFGGSPNLTFDLASNTFQIRSNANTGNLITTGNITFTSGGTQYDNPSPMGVMCATSMRLLSSMMTSYF